MGEIETVKAIEWEGDCSRCLTLYDNPIKNVPLKIVKKGSDVITYYFENKVKKNNIKKYKISNSCLQNKKYKVLFTMILIKETEPKFNHLYIITNEKNRTRH